MLLSKLFFTFQFINLIEFNQIKDEAGDSFYVRVGFDRTGVLNTDDLPFVKDEILYVSLVCCAYIFMQIQTINFLVFRMPQVDTTIFRGVFGQWRAWKLDKYGHRLNCGIIPSQMK